MMNNEMLAVMRRYYTNDIISNIDDCIIRNRSNDETQWEMNAVGRAIFSGQNANTISHSIWVNRQQQQIGENICI